MLREGEAIFDQLRDQWKRRIGTAQLESLEKQLIALVGTSPTRFDTPSWLDKDLGKSS